ncbi:MAG: hypothetical protein M3P42_06150 [Actinomycetota bacterium]|nr:hypothetical protein [Actinomycetota bacterium]
MPYRHSELGPALGAYGRLRPANAEGPFLLWPISGRNEFAEARPGAYSLSEILFHAAVVSDDTTETCRRLLGGAWRRSVPVVSANGETAASVWTRDDGTTLLPFDPNEVIRAAHSEAYQTMGGASLSSRAKTVARRVYYRVRPLLPRRVQIRMRRAFTRIQAKTKFPRWPVEPSLHDLYDWLFELTAGIAGRPVPRIAPWPSGHSWALVLTHDVETEIGYRSIAPLREIEEAAGCRSSWNFVPRRYEVEDAVVEELTASGFEVGVHGLHHDGLDLDSLAILRKRQPEMQEWAKRWGAVGFRAPALHRKHEWMPLLGFDYDSSSPDTDPYEPKAGGCLTWLPFFNGELVELPVTVPQDHTVFVILRRPDEALWAEKARFLRSRGGMVLVLTHPDYMLDESRLAAYRRFLAEFAADESGWKALPREVSAWWRRRAASTLELRDGEWRVVGPAEDEATIELTPASEAERQAA